MSADIGPGDFVEALFDGKRGPMRAGAVYQVLALTEPPRSAFGGYRPCSFCGVPGGKGGTALMLSSLKGRVCPCAVKPVYRPKPGAFDQLLKAPKREEHPA